MENSIEAVNFLETHPILYLLFFLVPEVSMVANPLDLDLMCFLKKQKYESTSDCGGRQRLPKGLSFRYYIDSVFTKAVLSFTIACLPFQTEDDAILNHA